jgi:hypothetical protein
MVSPSPEICAYSTGEFRKITEAAGLGTDWVLA